VSSRMAHKVVHCSDMVKSIRGGSLLHTFPPTLLGVSPMDTGACPGHEARNSEQRQNIDLEQRDLIERECCA
jgi:hypothetical protein